MADRQVTGTGKYWGDITALCGPWGHAGKETAISEIESGIHTYYVQDRYGGRVNVHVMNRATGKHLRTNRNSYGSDNLDNLPDCRHI